MRVRLRRLVWFLPVPVVAAAGALLVWTGPEPAARPAAEIERAAEEIAQAPPVDELAALLPFLDRGCLSQVEEGRGEGVRAMEVIGLVRTAPEAVWKTLTDYASYREFVPKLVQSKVLAREGNTARVRYEIDAPVRNFAYTQNYTEDAERRTILVRTVEGDVDGVFHWSLHPVRDGGETIVVYRGSARIAPTSWIVRWAIDKEPELEEMLSLASMTILLRGVRDRAEARSR